MRIGGRDTLILIGSMAATIVLSTVALVDFYAMNARELMNATRVFHYAEATLAAVAICAGCLKLL
jgi:hypothetical protein